MIFKILTNVEQDGTFDQGRPMKLILKKFQLSPQTHYSFDLSAATDRLPVELQAQILNIIKPNLGNCWKDLLIQMDYISD